MINRKLTGSSIHIYINPEKEVGESENIHGISDEFLKDKPKYAEIADVLFDYLKGAEIIAHNATFDMNFLNVEFERVGLGKLFYIYTKLCIVPFYFSGIITTPTFFFPSILTTIGFSKRTWRKNLVSSTTGSSFKYSCL